MANVIYNIFPYNEIGGGTQIDLDTDTIKVSLHTSSYTPDKVNHAFFSHLTNEISVGGYTAGGQALAGRSLSVTGDNKVKFDASDLSWTANVTGARWAVVYKDTGVTTTSPLICAIDFGADKDHTGGTFTIAWHADGILYLRQGT